MHGAHTADFTYLSHARADSSCSLVTKLRQLLEQMLQAHSSDDDGDGPSHRYPLRDRARLAAQQTPPKEQDHNRSRCYIPPFRCMAALHQALVVSGLTALANFHLLLLPVHGATMYHRVVLLRIA